MRIKDIIDMFSLSIGPVSKWFDYYDSGTGYIYAISEMYYDPDKNKTIIPVKDDKGIVGYVEEEGDLTK